MTLLRNFSRIFAGLVFIFSGIVKGVDPLGTAYKFGDYFLAMRLEWLSGAALFLAFLMIAAEFIIGWLLIFNVKTKINAWFVLLFMLVFTPLTLWLAVSNKVDDCGCFGDFLVMTNWETFYKNLVILAFVLILFFTRKQFKNRMAGYKQLLIGIAGAAIIGFTMYDAHQHLPRFDFRPFYRGAHISENMLPIPEVSEITLVYKNSQTGEEMAFSPQNLPYQDSVLWPLLKDNYVRREVKVIQEFQPAAAAFEILGPEGQDHSAEIIGNKEFQFIIVMNDIEKASKKGFKRLLPLIKQAEERNIRVIAITGSMYEEVETFLGEMGTPLEHYSSDVIKLKTVIRANPGLLLLKNGYILDKWHHNDIPDLDELNLCAPVDALLD
jgi:uncharacterized membrane protein YphA (DoxX/SURF4 family)